MAKKIIGLCAFAAITLLTIRGHLASTAEFELSVLLEEQTPGVSATGQTQLGLPYLPQAGIETVADLFHDINAAAGMAGCTAGPTGDCPVVSIARFLKEEDALEVYTGTGNRGLYAIDGTEGQRIQMRSSVNYLVVGSHDPGRVISLDAAGTNGSATGQTELSFPYHGTALNAVALYDEIDNQSASGNAVVAVARFLRGFDAFEVYSGVASSGNFPTAPGDSYRIQVRETVSYIPTHY